MNPLNSIPSKYIYIVIAIVVVILYWYFTTPASAAGSSRQLISNANLKGVKASQSDVALSKEKAYDMKLKEQADADLKLEQTIKDADPQKLAGSVNHALSTYEMKLEELKASRKTVPYYDGKPFSVSEKTKSSEPTQLLSSSTTSAPEILSPILPTELTASAPTADARPTRPNSQRTRAVKQGGHPSSKSPAPPSGDGQPAAVTHEVSSSDKQEDQVFNTYSYEVKKGGPAAAPGAATSAVPDSDMIEAAVFGDKTVEEGSFLSFRLTKPAVVSGVHFERNTIFQGKCSFGKDEIMVAVDGIERRDGTRVRTKLILRNGISAPTDKPKEATFDAAESGVESLLQTAAPTPLNLGATAAKVFRSAVSGGGTSVRVPSGIQVVFTPSNP